MTTYTDSLRRYPHMSGHGNAFIADGSAATPATFTTTDKARLVMVPGGVRVTGLTIRNTDLDTAATITAGFGYETAVPGSTLVASTTYFAAAQTILQAVARTELTFDPITFDEDVWITCTPAAGPATTAGTIKAIVTGESVGTKGKGGINP